MNGKAADADAMLVVTGTLKGYDALMNLVLDDVSEVLRGLSLSPTQRELC